MNVFSKIGICALTGCVAIGAAMAGEPVLGYQLDVSRGKIPTMKTLYRIVDTIADLGYRQFQLYGENYFKYRGHEKVSYPDAMTADEVRRLDDYCAKRGIELVPNQNSFGHMEPWLVEYPELAELPKGKVVTISPNWVLDKPKTLCPTDPRSIALVDDIHGQFLPCFRSRLFNVGCDETFELIYATNQTRSAAAIAEKGAVRLYFEFLMKVHELVAKRNHRMMFWADIILHRPEFVAELPKDVVALNWGYEANHPFEKQTAALEKSGREFYVCPGTSAWKSLSGRTDNMMENIDNAMSAGFRHGMGGVMLADWGDNGHAQPFLSSVPALVYAAHRFRGEKLTFGQLAAAIDKFLGCKAGESLLRYGNLYKLCGATRGNATYLAMWLNQGREFKRPQGMTDEALKATFAERDSARKARDLTGAPDWVRDGFETIDLLYDAVEACARGEFGTIRRRFEARYRELWLRHNRYSGLDDSIIKNLPE